MQEPPERPRACRDFISKENESLGSDFPIKNLTLAEVQSVLEWLDTNQPGWDNDIWVEGFVGKLDVDLAWDVFVPAVARVLSARVKQGFDPKEGARGQWL